MDSTKGSTGTKAMSRLEASLILRPKGCTGLVSTAEQLALDPQKVEEENSPN